MRLKTILAASAIALTCVAGSLPAQAGSYSSSYSSSTSNGKTTTVYKSCYGQSSTWTFTAIISYFCYPFVYAASSCDDYYPA